MMISRCAWHSRYFGVPLIKSVVRWQPFRQLEWTDGICDVCLARWRAARPHDARPAPPGRLIGALEKFFADAINR